MSEAVHVPTAAGCDCGILRNVTVPMSDGVRLATTVYLPSGQGPWPVVLVRTAYNRAGYGDMFFPTHGMALVVQDCRGRYESEGQFYPFIAEAADGCRTIEWIAGQWWCNGKVGMYGDSYLAATQFEAAPAAGRFLRALNPHFMTGDCWKRAYYCDGVFSLALTWSWLCFECASRVSHASDLPLLDVHEVLQRLPLLSLDEQAGAGTIQHYRDYVRRCRYDAQWQALRVRDRFDRFTMPVLLIGGWYDYYPGETAVNFTSLREQAATPGLRDSHRMIIGPWAHGISAGSVLGEVDFGPEAVRENDATRRWLDCMLHDGRPCDFQAAPIRIFVMGANVWRDEYQWPPARARATPYYLRADGRLCTEPPQAGEPRRQYVYDPSDPVFTRGGNHSVGPYNPGLYELVKPGPYDQRDVERRSDVLVYTSPVLERDIEIAGPIALKLHASSSARDTDFVARLTDVYPDGRSINIAEGVIRARFRENVWQPPKLMTPGVVYPFVIDLQATSNVFREGHRIRLHVTSSNFPLWDRNLNTGNDPGTDTAMVVAEQTIHHDAARPSHLVLPVLTA